MWQVWHYCVNPSSGVSMLTHTYPHKPLRKIKVAIYDHQADGPLYVCLISDLVICRFRKSTVIHDTECRFWDQVSLNNTNPTHHTHSNASGKIKVAILQSPDRLLITLYALCLILWFATLEWAIFMTMNILTPLKQGVIKQYLTWGDMREASFYCTEGHRNLKGPIIHIQ